MYVRVDKSNLPTPTRACPIRARATIPILWVIADVEVLWPREGCTVAALLIPALNGGRDGVEDNCQIAGSRNVSNRLETRLDSGPGVQSFGMFPTTGYFLTKHQAVLLIELGDILKVGGALSDERAFLQQFELVHQVVLLREVLYIDHEIGLRDAMERVLDLSSHVVRHGNNARLAHSRVIGMLGGLVSHLVFGRRLGQIIDTTGGRQWAGVGSAG